MAKKEEATRDLGRLVDGGSIGTTVRSVFKRPETLGDLEAQLGEAYQPLLRVLNMFTLMQLGQGVFDMPTVSCQHYLVEVGTEPFLIVYQYYSPTNLKNMLKEALYQYYSPTNLKNMLKEDASKGLAVILELEQPADTEARWTYRAQRTDCDSVECVQQRNTAPSGQLLKAGAVCELDEGTAKGACSSSTAQTLVSELFVQELVGAPDTPLELHQLIDLAEEHIFPKTIEHFASSKLEKDDLGLHRVTGLQAALSRGTLPTLFMQVFGSELAARTQDADVRLYIEPLVRPAPETVPDATNLHVRVVLATLLPRETTAEVLGIPDGLASAVGVLWELEGDCVWAYRLAQLDCTTADCVWEHFEVQKDIGAQIYGVVRKATDVFTAPFRKLGEHIRASHASRKSVVPLHLVKDERLVRVEANGDVSGA